VLPGPKDLLISIRARTLAQHSPKLIEDLFMIYRKQPQFFRKKEKEKETTAKWAACFIRPAAGSSIWQFYFRFS
jgi:hypothetical protein